MNKKTLLLATMTTVSLGASTAGLAKSRDLRPESKDYLAKSADGDLLLAYSKGGHGDVNHCLISGNCGVSVFSG